MKKDLNKASRWIFLGVPLLVGLIVYMMNLTQTALGYDESIEYFFSKYTSGAVPGGRYTSSMYERIVSTYQPPLYNWLMHLWLIFFDSEYSFRLAGALITLLGTMGIFAGLSELTDYRWASLGSLMYVFTSSISYYALECAEYNLMLCCVAWSLFFYIKTVLTDRMYSLVGFFIFACFSVYSQYGAVFLMVVLYLSLFIHFVCNKKKEMIKKLLILTVFVLVIAALPLAYFFLLPQLQHQGTTGISHNIHFANDRNIAVDFIVSVLRQLGFIFGGRGELPQIIKGLPTKVIDVAIIATIIAGLGKKKMLNNLIGICIVSWLIYYIMTACSLYGYNNWNAESLGTNNIGNRYGLFLSPLWILTLTYGIFLFSIIIKEKASKKIWMGYRVLFAFAVFIFCGVGVLSVYKPSKKDEVREATKVWYENNAYDSITLVHESSDANFQFYLMHSDCYSEDYQERILTADRWIRDAEFNEMKENLRKMGIFEFQEFYYIVPYNGRFNDSYDIFIEVMKSEGYNISIVYEGKSRLLYLNSDHIPVAQL